MSEKTVYFFTSVPFSEQHQIDLEVDYFSYIFRCVRVDLSKLYNRNYAVNSLAEIKINDFGEFLKFVSDMEDRPVILTNILNSDLPLIYGSLKKKKALICGFTKEVQSGYYAKRNYNEHSLTVKLKHTVKNILIRMNLYNRKYDVLFANYDYEKGKRKSFVRIHHIKYDLIRGLKPVRLVAEDYIVFCDVGLSNHPMFDNDSNRLPLDLYLAKMNALFDYLEQTLNKKVVISVHPKVHYDADAFKGRAIFSGVTPSLIYYSSFVVCHYTTSINEAVLLKKPILFAYSDSFFKYSSSATMHSGTEIAKDLNVRPYNIDKLNQNEDLNSFLSTEGYDRFIKKYLIAEEQKEKTNAEIIVNYLNDKGFI